MKKCPYCAEEIQDKAVVCKHCGRDLVPKKEAPVKPAKRKTSFTTWGCLTLIILIIIVFFMARTDKKSSPIKETEEKPILTTEQIIASRIKAKEFIALLNSDKMRRVGLIYKAERALGSTMGLIIYVTNNWYLSPYDDKIELLETFYIQWKAANDGEGWLEIRDFQTGKKIAKCDAFGSKIY